MNLQKVLPPVWFLLSIIIMIGLHLWLPVKQLFFPPITYLDIGAMAVGMAVVLFCDRSISSELSSNRICGC
ncbi:MAG: hypothetical protein QNJ72_19490 [Pleurocapsa sp. MO_226.B13]|nr:hypothetical protein [Pleurocapsa sp. MO_226.B13]